MIAHPQDMGCVCRGKYSKDLSLVEYACIIEVVKNKEQLQSLHTGDTDASSTAVDSGLKHGHDVLLFEHDTKIVNTKIDIPLLCGEKPPNLQQLFQKIGNNYFNTAVTFDR